MSFKVSDHVPTPLSRATTSEFVMPVDAGGPGGSSGPPRAPVASIATIVTPVINVSASSSVLIRVRSACGLQYQVRGGSTIRPPASTLQALKLTARSTNSCADAGHVRVRHALPESEEGGTPRAALTKARGILQESAQSTTGRCTVSATRRRSPATADPREGAEEFCACLLTVRVLVVSIPAPRCDHREHEATALAEQFLISARIVLARPLRAHGRGRIRQAHGNTSRSR